MNKEKLKNAFEECKELSMPICVALKIPNQEENELIINGVNSLNNKLDYYMTNYDEGCSHNNNSGVKIVAAFPIKFYYDEEDKRAEES